MLKIECETCKSQFLVDGYTTPDSFYEPGEVVTELQCNDELCNCLNEGGEYVVLDESHETFDDDCL